MIIIAPCTISCQLVEMLSRFIPFVIIPIMSAPKKVPHIPPYLVPQECGCHTDTWAASLHMADGAQLLLEKSGDPFAFSALPHTLQELEQAAHSYELPKPVRTVVTVCGAMRGVGGIDSWGSDVEPPFRVSGETGRAFSVRFLCGGAS